MRTNIKRRVITLLVMTLVVPVLFAGGQQEETPAPAEGSDGAEVEQEVQELRIGIPQEPADLNAIMISDLYSEALAGNIYDTLVSLKEDSSDPQPLLAESWEISDDGLTYTFSLREDVVFHNGDSLTAEDVQYTYEQILDPDNASPSAEFFQQIEDVIVDDEYTIRFELDSPYAALILAMGNPSTGIIPKAYTEEVGMDALDSQPVGTGPYRFVELVPDDRIVLERNSDYFLAEPALDRVVFRPIPQAETMTAELLSGGIHIATNILPQDIDRIDNRNGIDVQIVPGLSNRYLGFVDDEEPFSDVRFRQAVYHMIDVDAMVQGIWGQAGTRAYSWIPPNTLGGETDDLEDAALQYDPDRAAELIDELRSDGVLEDDFSFTIYSVDDPLRLRVAQAVATALREYDISASVESPEFGTLLPMLEEGVPIYTMGWGSVPDPDRWTYRIFHSSSNRNFSQYENSEVDDLLERGRRVTDIDERRDIYHQVMEQTLATDYVHIPLVWLNQIVGVDEAVEGFEASPQGYFNLVTAERNVSLQ